MEYMSQLTEQQALHLEEWKKIESLAVERIGELRITSQDEMLEYTNKLNLRERKRRNKLAELIQNSGLLYSELALILGCSKSSIEQYVRGVKTPPINTALILAKLFKTSVEEIFES